ncbi:MAG: hypothetical protein A3K30_03215 [Deltaproteobacteria bacterium RBG_13_51_10]|nr:MAG: hypothetical protein A3K30_03215 [Deltaproteobacteria bacterium RBG_13_51_10]
MRFHLAWLRFLCKNCFNEMKTCLTCHYYQWCLSLCKEAKAYVSQDEVKQKELPIGIPVFSQIFSTILPPISLSPAEKKVGTLLSMSVPRETIAQLMGISNKTLRNKISEMSHKYYNGDDFLL